MYVFWRYIWFFRNPTRRSPVGEHLVSPADGTVVYVKQVSGGEPIISMKKGRSLKINDLAREDIVDPKWVIGIFMSPFDVHYNRSPISGRIDFINHHPAEPKNRHMTAMHWRCLMKLFPLYENSRHILTNERTVTKITGALKKTTLSCYIVQIAGGSVKGIDTFMPIGSWIQQGKIFGMIRVGSQVDLICTGCDFLRPMVKPGDKVRAGETILLQ